MDKYSKINYKLSYQKVPRVPGFVTVPVHDIGDFLIGKK